MLLIVTLITNNRTVWKLQQHLENVIEAVRKWHYPHFKQNFKTQHANNIEKCDLSNINRHEASKRKSSKSHQLSILTRTGCYACLRVKNMFKNSIFNQNKNITSNLQFNVR